MEDECAVYDEAATAEEERTALLARVLSASADEGDLGLDNVIGAEGDDAIQRSVY